MSTKSDLLREVIKTNRSLLQQAQVLNVRAGQKVFPAFSRTELAMWLARRLMGARSMQDIRSLDDLRLPELNQGLMDQVTSQNPESIELLGQQLMVEYRDGSQPKVTLRFENQNDYSWRTLQDGGVNLPSGRPVAVAISFGWSATCESTSIPELKEKVRQYLNQKQWDGWSKPTLPKPNVEDESAVLPELTQATYGKCVVTGESLTAFGTVYYDSWNGWKVGWYRDCQEAEKARKASVTVFKQKQAEARERREREQARTEGQTVQQKVSKAYSDHRYGLSPDLQSRLYSRCYASLPSTATEIRQWIADSEALLAEVDAVVAEMTRQKEEEAGRQRAEDEKIRAMARPILRPGEEESDSTLYGMPCNDYEPCLPRDATMWRLYSWRDGRFCRHKGFRSQSTGTTFRELVAEYFRGEPELPEVLAALEKKPAVVAMPTVEGGKFTDVGNRWFKCGSGHTTRVDKADWRRYEQGEVLLLSCSLCGSQGMMKR